MNQKQWIGAVIVLVLGAGLWYYIQLNQSIASDSTSATTSQGNTDANRQAASVSVDQSSLTSANGIFSITGTASGARELYIHVVPDMSFYSDKNDLGSLLSATHEGATAYVYSDSIRIVDGRWASTPNRAPYVGGKYKVFVFDISTTTVKRGRDVGPSCTPVSCEDVPLIAEEMLTVQ